LRPRFMCGFTTLLLPVALMHGYLHVVNGDHLFALTRRVYQQRLPARAYLQLNLNTLPNEAGLS
jgi:hypothetical protein